MGTGMLTSKGFSIQKRYVAAVHHRKDRLMTSKGVTPKDWCKRAAHCKSKYKLCDSATAFVNLSALLLSHRSSRVSLGTSMYPFRTKYKIARELTGKEGKSGVCKWNPPLSAKNPCERVQWVAPTHCCMRLRDVRAEDHWHAASSVTASGAEIASQAQRAFLWTTDQ